MVARDSQAIAWAEQRYGCEDHARDLLDLSITGISEMGVVMSGLVRGSVG